MRSLLVVAVMVAAASGVARADLTSLPEAPSDEAARALLERWLKAQNDGDFAAYQVLYAPGFTGRRRSGDRIVELDRAGWMRDRARMFKKKMRVAADDVKTIKGSGFVSVVFTQTWASASYRDVGRKRLMVVADAGEPRILREDMLTSAKDDPQVEPLSDGQVDTLRCLFKDVDARWRRADGGTVESIQTAPHQGATAVWVTTSNGDWLALCRGSKRIAGGSIALGGGPGHPMAITSRELRGDYLQVKPGLFALAIVGTIGTYEDVPGYQEPFDAPEGLEESASGTQLDLFVRVGDQLLPIYSDALVVDFTCNFSVCTNQSCELVAGKKGPTGWFDLVEKCDLFEVENGNTKKSHHRNRRYVWSGDNYVGAIQPVKTR